MTGIRTRFAPSPTGFLHIGGARTALFNWLLARSQGGVFVLRVEDTDVERSTRELIDVILEGMDWLGLDYDEGPYFQSERKQLHLEYVQKLLDSGRAYYCHCTAEDLAARREEALKRGGKPKYDGRCRDKNLGPAPGATIRFKGPQTGETGWNDLIKGLIVHHNEELDDLIILRSDGSLTYNMAVVVDDLTMGITHVIRGDDHINNTPRQILLYQALEVPIPAFGHMPLTLGKDKAKLSKRHGAVSVLAYREDGYLPETMVNFLVRLGWSYGDEEIFSREDLIKKFSLDNVGKSPGIFDLEKLQWLNAHYIREADPSRLAGLIAPILKKQGRPAVDPDYLARAVVTLQPRARTLVELAEAADFYLADEIEYDDQAAKKFLKADMAPVMVDLIERLKALDFFSEKNLEAVFTDLLEAHDIKLGKIAQPARVALTGRTASPGLFEIMDVLGKDRVISRLEKGYRHMLGRTGETGE